MKQTKLAMLILGLLMMIGCSISEEEKKEVKEPQKTLSLQERLQGDWISIGDQKEYWDKEELHLNVSDSSFSLFSLILSPNYVLRDSLLIVEDSVGYFVGELGSINRIYSREYKILTLSDSTLMLKSLTEDVNKHLEILFSSSDTLCFRKLEKQNNIKPSGIEFSCSASNSGFSPSYMIKVTDNYNVKYMGGAYAKKQGSYSGKIPDQLYKALIRNVNYLNLDSLKETYEVHISHGQTRCLVIYTAEDTIKTYVYPSYIGPGELNLLMNTMEGLSYHINLSKNSKVIDSLSFNSFLQIDYLDDIEESFPPPSPLKEEE
jgi:hypothetical protein